MAKQPARRATAPVKLAQNSEDQPNHGPFETINKRHVILHGPEQLVKIGQALGHLPKDAGSQDELAAMEAANMFPRSFPHIEAVLDSPIRSSLESIAELIEKKPPSMPMVRLLAARFETMQLMIKGDTLAPSGTKLEQGLKDLASEARSLSDRLTGKGNNHYVSVFIRQRSPSLITNAIHENLGFLKVIADHADQLAEKVAQEKPGRGKVYPNPEGYDPREYCALLVISMWQAVHGVVPRAAAKAPRLAAEAYYLAAGGPPGTTIATTPRAWEKDFKSALARRSDIVRMTDDAIGAMNLYKLHQK